MSKRIRIVGWLNIGGGIVLAMIVQTLKVSSAEIAAAHDTHMPPPSGLDSFSANVGSVSMLIGAAIGSLLFFAVARILDRVESIHRTIAAQGKDLTA